MCVGGVTGPFWRFGFDWSKCSWEDFISNLSNSELLVAPTVLEAQAWTRFTHSSTRFTSTGASWSVAMGRAPPIDSLVSAGHLPQFLPALSQYHCTSLTILYYGNFHLFSVQMMSSKFNFDSFCLIQHDEVVLLSSAVTESCRQWKSRPAVALISA